MVGDKFKIQYYNYNGSNNFFQYGCSIYSNSVVQDPQNQIVVKLNDRPLIDQDVVGGDSSFDDLNWSSC